MTEPSEPRYPQTPQYPHTPPPAYPQAPRYPDPPAPAYPHTPTPPPTYPAPPYPQAQPQPQPAHPPQPPQPPPAPAHPHEMRFTQRRSHISEYQRGADATAIGGLLLHVPNFLGSLLVVGLVSLFFGAPGLLLVLAWLAGGALVVHRPTERALARYVLKLRPPTHQELARLAPVWREVLTRAGIEQHTYELWVEDSDELNAVAAAGHIVGVTRFALEQLPSGQLAAVLAHELGHHVGGHSWSGLLGYWYALPGRIAWRVMQLMAYVIFRVSSAFSCLGGLVVLAFFGFLAFMTVSALYGLPLLLPLIPYLMAAVSRRAELLADRQAAALDFAPMLAEVLWRMHTAQEQAKAAAAAAGRPLPRQSPLARLLSSHPDHHTRLHHLAPYLQPHPQPPG
ncbi:M48 family metalloprotease [Streptomyces sp. SID8361]|nr:M48 family metalloprotease [Streptomyces sp. SID8361]